MVRAFDKTRILVLTLSSGENELEESLKMLKRQTYTNWESVVLSDLNNKEAHDSLYQYIMDHTETYDLFMKLDADMVFMDELAMENIVHVFNRIPDMDQGNFAVRDVMSNQNIMGLLVFSNRARWYGSSEQLFVDYTPRISGKRLLIWSRPAPVALHSPNPHPFQAFHFGAHRAMKAIQKNRKPRKWIQSALQWHLLSRVWQYFDRYRNAERGYMMLGAFAVWSDAVDQSANEYKSSSLRAAFEKYSTLSTEDMYALLSKTWRKVVLYNHVLYSVLWPKLIEYKLRCQIAAWYYMMR